MLTMARRGRFGSSCSIWSGLLVVAAAAFAVVRLWQDKDAQLVAAHEAMAEGVAQGPAVQVAQIVQGPKERLITLLRRHTSVPGRHAVWQSRAAI